MKRTLLLCSSMVLGHFALAQSSISDASKHAYSANVGWINFKHDQPADPAGVVVGSSFVHGYAYSANVGWINLGDGSPSNGHQYSNAAGDHGVNHDGRGNLSGYAYSANTGWINFGWTDSSSLQRPRVNLLTGAMSGYVYSANLGWINLGTGDLAVASIIRDDSDMDGLDDAWEMQYFGSLATADGSSNLDGDTATDAEEYGAGTDPTVSGSALTIVSQIFSQNRTSVTLEFTSSATRAYRIEYTQDIADPLSWTDSPLGTFFSSNAATTTKSFTFASVEGQQYFFRVVAVVPLP